MADREAWLKARHERLERDNWTCQAGTFGLTTSCDPWPSRAEVHHRLPRGRGGASDVDLLVTLCSGHHRWVESNRTAAYKLGLLMRSSS